MGFHDECGVVGIYGCENAARLSYFALTSLQHRGQESAGIAVSEVECQKHTKVASTFPIKLHKGIGLVSEVFKNQDLEKLSGSISVAHVRYATAGGRTIENAQPFLNSFKNGSIALSHNGQLVNHAEIRAMLEDKGATFSSSSDSEVILKLIVRRYIENGGHLGRSNLESSSEEEKQMRFIEAVKETASLIKGSFSLCIMTENMLIGVRDPNGIRPLCLGKVDKGYILASESCAIDAVNGEFIRDIENAEIVVINQDGVKSFNYEKSKKETCIFEYVYFARPDSIIDGIPVQEARYRLGRELAKESQVDADVVIGVPDSGIGAAMGYSKESGIPYVTGIIKNKYIGRTFIAPTQAEREAMVFVKLNAIKSDLEGKKVIVIDDSIVRGTTSRRLVEILRRAGAKEVHFRVSSSPVKFPCHLGIDTPSKNELISSSHEVDEICREIGADSLAFISLDGMLKALGNTSFCKGCFNGKYPVAEKF
ncbi:MAG: amidophosphoribosyltransferase [Treponemataceae bacterium]|nr:amidophosphoribosyltransferase [Treponemataceae bacterium]